MIPHCSQAWKPTCSLSVQWPAEHLRLFWQSIYRVSDKAREPRLCLPAAHLGEAIFSSPIANKTTYGNRLNTEVVLRIQFFPRKPSTEGFCWKVKLRGGECIIAFPKICYYVNMQFCLLLFSKALINTWFWISGFVFNTVNSNKWKLLGKLHNF